MGIQRKSKRISRKKFDGRIKTGRDLFMSRHFSRLNAKQRPGPRVGPGKSLHWANANMVQP